MNNELLELCKIVMERKAAKKAAFEALDGTPERQLDYDRSWFALSKVESLYNQKIQEDLSK